MIIFYPIIGFHVMADVLAYKMVFIKFFLFKKCFRKSYNLVKKAHKMPYDTLDLMVHLMALELVFKKWVYGRVFIKLFLAFLNSVESALYK